MPCRWVSAKVSGEPRSQLRAISSYFTAIFGAISSYFPYVSWGQVSASSPPWVQVFASWLTVRLRVLPPLRPFSADYTTEGKGPVPAMP